jgi:hypothetical protein
LWLDSTALHALSDLHGPSSSQVLSATKILSSALAGINEVFEKNCDGKVFIATVTTDSSHTRRTRSLLAAADSVKADGDVISSKIVLFFIDFGYFAERLQFVQGLRQVLSCNVQHFPLLWNWICHVFNRHCK